MKKLLLAIPLVAGASWAGAAIYSGVQTQSAYEQLLAQLNELKLYALVNETYSAGFLNSTAVTKVMDSAAPDAKVLFRLQHAIDHSPVAVVDSNVRFAAANIKTTLLSDDSLPEAVVDFMQGFVDAEPFQIHTQVGLDGNSRYQLLVSAYQHQQDGLEMSFSGLDYSADVKADIIKGSGEIGEMTVEGHGRVLTLTPGVIATDLTRISQAVYAGHNGVNFDELTVSSGQGMAPDVVLESVGVTFDNTVENDQLNSRTRIHVGKVESLLPLNSASLDVGMTNLSISGFSQYVEAVYVLPVSDGEVASEIERLEALMSAFLPAIGPGTGLDFKLRFSNDGGSASLDYGVSVVEESSPHYPAGGLNSIATVRDLLNVIYLEAHLNADADAIDRTPLAMFMASPQAQRTIVADGTSYQADITVKDLIVDVNGNPLSLELMLGEMLDKPLKDFVNL